MDAIVKVIKARIEEKGVSLTFVAKKAGMSLDALSASLLGNRRLMATEFLFLCRVLELTFKDFKDCAECVKEA